MMKVDGAGADGRPAIVYVRSSTAAQGESGIGLALQRAGTKAFAKAEGYHVVEVFEDVASARGAGNMFKRPGLQNALTAAKKCGGVLIVYNWSRLTRHDDDLTSISAVLPAERILSVVEAENLALGARAGRLASAEEAGRQIAERTREGMAKKKMLTGARYGNPDIRSIQKNGARAVTAKKERLREVLADVLAGLGWPEVQVSNQALASEMNARGLRTGQNLPFNAKRVRAVRKGAERKLLERAARSEAAATQVDDEVLEEDWVKPPSWGRF